MIDLKAVGADGSNRNWIGRALPRASGLRSSGLIADVIAKADRVTNIRAR
jgi:hypothetical protein